MARTTTYTVAARPATANLHGSPSLPTALRSTDEPLPASYTHCGGHPWRELVDTRGMAGTLLLETYPEFGSAATRAPAPATRADEWHSQVFTRRPVTRRGDTRTFECTETRPPSLRAAKPAAGRRARFPSPGRSSPYVPERRQSP
jgi:hypothetical protein